MASRLNLLIIPALPRETGFGVFKVEDKLSNEYEFGDSADEAVGAIVRRFADKVSDDGCVIIDGIAVDSPGTDWFDIDNANYVGDGDNGCYYATREHRPGHWYCTVIVDSETGSFVDTLVENAGPFRCVEDAELAGRNAGYDWCSDNEISWEGLYGE